MFGVHSFKRSINRQCGQKFIDTAELCTDNIYKILWQCLDLKARDKSHHLLGKTLSEKRVTILCGNQCNPAILIVQAAMKTLGANLRFMFADQWEESKFKKDVGRFYSLYSDMIIVEGQNHLSLCELTAGATVPVVNISSHKFAPLHGLGLLMTLQEHFGRLSGLKVGWVGPMGRHLNTLLYLLPKVGIHLRYNCQPKPNFPASPLVLPTGEQLCKTFQTTIVECCDASETITGADVIGTTKHRETTRRIELEMLDKASPNWVFFHFLPRREEDVAKDVFTHSNSLVWTLHENIQYSIMAVVLDLLKGYQPVMAKPNFGFTSSSTV